MTQNADSVRPLTYAQRMGAIDAMYAAGLNKCGDCCLVPDCQTCGPCDEHDETTEAIAALEFAKAAQIDGSGAQS